MLFKYVAPAKQADERSTLPPPAIKIKLGPTKCQPSGPRFNADMQVAMLGRFRFRSAPATSPDTGDPVDAESGGVRRYSRQGRSASVHMQARARRAGTAFYQGTRAGPDGRCLKRRGDGPACAGRAHEHALDRQALERRGHRSPARHQTDRCV